MSNPTSNGISIAARDVLAERQRQIQSEGWAPEHDDQHSNFELTLAAVCYALCAARPQVEWLYGNGATPQWWPWAKGWWKPRGARRELVRAAALIVAEIERMDRRNGVSGTSAHETTAHDPLRSFAEWAAGASCDDEYAPRAVKHIAALAKDALSGSASLADIVGYPNWKRAAVEPSRNQTTNSSGESSLTATASGDTGGAGLLPAASSPDQLCKRCRHSYAQHTKGAVPDDYCRHCVCPAFVPYSPEKASGEYQTYPGEPITGIYEAGVAIVRLGKDDEATGE